VSATLALPVTIVDDMLSKISQGITGGTYSVDGRVVPDHGFFVGGAVPSLINPTREQMIDFIETAGADYVGFWEDSETLALYVDAVDHTDSEPYAVRLAQLRGESAYWDASKGQEVRTPAYLGYES
jgi:hypothetical protein